MILTRFVNAGVAPAQMVPIDDAGVVETLTADDDLAEADEKTEPQPH